LLFAAGAAETAALVETLGAGVVGVGPKLCAAVAAGARLEEHRLDQFSAEARAPALGRDKDGSDVAEVAYRGPGAVVREALHSDGHAGDIAIIRDK
jgi:hypothetical protein